MSNSSIDHKIVILGTAFVGKASIIHHYCTGILQIETIQTIGAGFFTHTVQVDSREVTLFLWDTVGTERFRSVAPSLVRGAHGVVLVLVSDVSDPQTFSDLAIYLELFLDAIQPRASGELPVLVLGNKSALERPVDQETVDTFCTNNNFSHSYYSSTKTGQGVDDAMTALVKTVPLSVQNDEKDNSVALTTVAVGTEKNGCC
jgi:small GTP-binding protein